MKDGEKKMENNNLELAIVEIANTLFEKRNINPNYSYSYIESEYLDILKKSKEIIFKIHDEAQARTESEVYCGDLVVLSINKANPRRFYINRDEKVREEIQPRNGKYVTNFEIIDAYSKLGQELMGRHVGDKFYASVDDNVKNEQTVEILACRKTSRSEKISKYELQAELGYKTK
jgi:hypothetical protein